MTQPINPDHSQFRPMIHFLRKYGDRVHIIRLSPKNFELAKVSLRANSEEAMEQKSGIPRAVWLRWKAELESLEQLRSELDQFLSVRGTRLLSLPESLEKKVLEVSRQGVTQAVSRQLGLPRKALSRLLSQAAQRQNEAPSTPGQGIEEDNAASIDDVRAMISRHKGRVRRKYSRQEKKRILEMVDRFGSKVVNEELGVAFDTLARWQRKRFEKPEVRRHVGLRYIPVLELMREHPGMGPMQIRDYLRRHKGLQFSVGSIRRVMEDNGWVPPYARISRDNSDLRRYEAIRRNYLWHLDFKHHWINSCKAFLLFVLDDHSRFIVGHIISDAERIEPVVEVIERAIALHGKPEVIMTDGGSAFRSWRGQSQFTTLLEDYGIDQLIAKTPNVNGKSENLHQQLEKEVLIPTRFSSLEHCAEEVSSWVGFFNFMRPHQGLGDGQVPADRYHPGVRRWFEARNSTASTLEETLIRLLGQGHSGSKQ